VQRFSIIIVRTATSRQGTISANHATANSFGSNPPAIVNSHVFDSRAADFKVFGTRVVATVVHGVNGGTVSGSVPATSLVVPVGIIVVVKCTRCGSSAY
jgi:hypothetical protein